MKNPLYPSTIITKETFNNYGKCLIITLENNPIDEIFDENVNDTFCNKIKDNYKITSIPMWIIKHLEHHKFIVFEIIEEDILKFKFAGVDFGKKIKEEHPHITKENYLEYIDKYYQNNEAKIELSKQELEKEINSKQKLFFSKKEYRTKNL